MDSIILGQLYAINEGRTEQDVLKCWGYCEDDKTDIQEHINRFWENLKKKCYSDMWYK